MNCNLLGYLFVLSTYTANTPAMTLTQNTSKDAVARKDRGGDVLFRGRRTKI